MPAIALWDQKRVSGDCPKSEEILMSSTSERRRTRQRGLAMPPDSVSRVDALRSRSDARRTIIGGAEERQWLARALIRSIALLVFVALAFVGCGGSESNSREPPPPEPPAASPEEAPETGEEEPSSSNGKEPSPEPELPTPTGLDPPFTLEIGDAALVVGGDVLCMVSVEGISCAEAGESGPKRERYGILLSSGDLRVTFAAADGELETVFSDTHEDPSGDRPSEPVEPPETVILEGGDAVRVTGTDVVCVAGEIGFIGCSRLAEGGGLRPRTLAVGLDSAGVSVARIEADGTLAEVFSRAYDSENASSQGSP